MSLHRLALIAVSLGCAAACGAPSRPRPAAPQHAVQRAPVSASTDGASADDAIGWSRDSPLPACGIEAAPAQLRATLTCPDGARPFAETSDEAIQGALVRVTQEADGEAAAAEFRARCEHDERRAFVDLTACEDLDAAPIRIDAVDDPMQDAVEDAVDPEAVEAT